MLKIDGNGIQGVSIYLSSISQSVYLSVGVYLSVCLSVCLPSCLSCLSCQSVSQSVSMFLLSFCLSVCLSSCLSSFFVHLVVGKCQRPPLRQMSGTKYCRLRQTDRYREKGKMSIGVMSGCIVFACLRNEVFECSCISMSASSLHLLSCCSWTLKSTQTM